MGTITFILAIVVVLAIIGGGAGAFFGSVSNGVKTSIDFVEKSPTLKNLSEEVQRFTGEQVGNVVKEMG